MTNENINSSFMTGHEGKENNWINRAKLNVYAVPLEKYKELPDELREFYCYTRDGGHCLICIVPEYLDNENRDDYLAPACVKTVLRTGYEIRDGYLVCSIPYDMKIRLLISLSDYEY